MFNEKVKGLKRFNNVWMLAEMCVVATKVKIQSKLSDKGSVCVFVGYAVNFSTTSLLPRLNPFFKALLILNRFNHR